MTSPEAEPEGRGDVRELERLIEEALDRRGVRGGGGTFSDGTERRIASLEKAQGDIADTLAKLLDRTAASDAKLASIEAKLDAKASTTEVAKALASLETRLEKTLASIEAKLDSKASAADVATIEAKLDSKASAADVAKIAGRVESLPTTWQMITLVVGIVGTLLGGAFIILKTALPHAP